MSDKTPAFHRIQNAYNKRHDEKFISNFKKKAKRIFGYFETYVPEEIIAAAGIVPIRIIGSAEEQTYADAYLNRAVCPFMRSCFDQALRGKYDQIKR